MRKQFGDRLKELRLEKDMTQQELADLFNTGKASISHYESNRRIPDANNIERYAEFFNTTTDYILGRTNTRNPEQNQLKENPSPLLEKIANLSPESIEELEKYMELLKIKEQMDKSKDETSSALEKDA